MESSNSILSNEKLVNIINQINETCNALISALEVNAESVGTYGGWVAHQINTEYVDITWEECTLRSWLNEDFYQSAFSEEEQEWIALTQVINEDNPKYNTEGGNDTEDKVFLLSIAEANEYFADDEDRKVYATQYAKDNGAYVSVNTSASWWWLRSPGGDSGSAANVLDIGRVYAGGDYVYFADYVVRPALWITLES